MRARNGKPGGKERPPARDVESLTLTVYSSAPQKQSLTEMFSDLRLARHLAWRLAIRDISAMYRQSILGIGWVLVTPLVTTLMWVFLSGAGIVSVRTPDIPYPLYVFVGTMLWQVFAEAFQAPTIEVIAGQGMLSRVNFPKEAIVLSGVLKSLFNGGVKLLLVIVVVVAFGLPMGWKIVLAPLAIGSLVLAGTALGLLLAPMGSLYHDVGRGSALATQLWMYITPVVFPIPERGWVAGVFAANPLTPLIVVGRDWLTGSEHAQLVSFLLVNASMILLLVVGWVAYRICMPILVERMNA